MTRAIAAARRAVIESACEWLVTLHDEDVTAADRAAFAAWLTESPVHVREYLMTESDWRLLGRRLGRSGSAGNRPRSGPG